MFVKEKLGVIGEGMNVWIGDGGIGEGRVWENGELWVGDMKFWKRGGSDE